MAARLGQHLRYAGTALCCPLPTACFQATPLQMAARLEALPRHELATAVSEALTGPPHYPPKPPLGSFLSGILAPARTTRFVEPPQVRPPCEGCKALQDQARVAVPACAFGRAAANRHACGSLGSRLRTLLQPWQRLSRTFCSAPLSFALDAPCCPLNTGGGCGWRRPQVLPTHAGACRQAPLDWMLVHCWPAHTQLACRCNSRAEGPSWQVERSSTLSTLNWLQGGTCGRVWC